MSEFKVASRYAKALLDLAKEQQAVDDVKADMEAFISVVRSNAELKAVLGNPIVPIGKKSNILALIFKGKAHDIVLKFFNIMSYKGRAGILYATAIEFIRQYNVYRNIVSALVTSATPLSKETEKELIDKLSQAYAAEITLENKVDPDLIGGFVLKIGDEQIDASVLGKLNKLSRSFKDGRVKV